jgi:hypothetical protein
VPDALLITGDDIVQAEGEEYLIGIVGLRLTHSP